jgi:N-acetylmuramoyl-L-alanine amidase
MNRTWIPAFAGMTMSLGMTLGFSVVAKEVAVDVGHYAAEPGVISASGRPEFEYNRDLALEVKSELETAGVQVRLIGERGDYAVLHHRTRDARGADLFVSIHHDSVREYLLPQADRFAGFSLFVSRLNPFPGKSLACASSIGAKLKESGFTPSRYHADPVLGEARPFADEANGVHYYDNLAVARSAAMASVLVEAGVIVNREEDQRMRDPQVRSLIAGAVAAGVRDCLAKER